MRSVAPTLALAALIALAPWSTARAHYPHDVAHWVAISPDPDEPRLATSLERINVDLLGRSEDGLSWAARLVPASQDLGGVGSGAFLTPQRLVLATPSAGLQVSEDAGDTITREPTVEDDAIARVVASPAVLEDGLAFVAGETAIWRTTDGGSSWEPVLAATGEGFTDVDLSPDFAEDGRVCALEAEALACSADSGDTWSLARPPQAPYRLSVGAGRRLWISTRGEGLWTSEDEGTSWAQAGFGGEDVTAVAELEGGLVLLAMAEEAGWRSTDGGASWEQVDIFAVPFDQGVDGVNFFDFVAGPDGAVYLTYWFGLARSDDDGQSWRTYDTEPIENTHAVTLTEGADGALQAWIGTYGGGPVLVDLATLRAWDFGALTGRFTRDTPVTTSWQRDGVAIFDEGYDTYRSVDGGASWQSLEEVSHAGEQTLANDVKGVALAPDTSVDPFVLLSVGQGSMAFWASEDLGETWTIGTQDPPCDGLGLAAALSPRWPEESRAWASCDGAVYESTDRGESWRSLGDVGAFVFELAEQQDGALLIASRDGLWRHDGEHLTRIAFEGRLVMSVAAAVEPGDETVFALVPTLGWFRSDDGAETWTELPAPTADFPRMISISPRFSEDGTVAVAGYGGAWASTDRGEHWFSIHALEIHECDHDAWETSGSWETVNRQGASGGRVVSSQEPGATRSLSFEGVDLSLRAPADAAEGVLDLSLDGGPAERIALPAADGVVWWVEGLGEGWHTLEIEVVEGTVVLDVLRIARIAGADAGEASETGGGCSCRRAPTSGAGATALLLLPLALLRRRRLGLGG